jgi:hypothetical protein
VKWCTRHCSLEVVTYVLRNGGEMFHEVVAEGVVFEVAKESGRG